MKLTESKITPVSTAAATYNEDYEIRGFGESKIINHLKFLKVKECIYTTSFKKFHCFSLKRNRTYKSDDKVL